MYSDAKDILKAFAIMKSNNATFKLVTYIKHEIATSTMRQNPFLTMPENKKI